MLNKDSDPRTTFFENLTRAVHDGNVTEARKILRKNVLMKTGWAPPWEDLKTALDNEDKGMTRLLVTFGAPVNDTPLQTKTYAPLLRAAGYQGDLPDTATTPDITTHAKTNATIPSIHRVWSRVLSALQTCGAKETVIAGGAIRDLFHDRPINDIDIFLCDRGSPEKNLAFLKEALKRTGLELEEQHWQEYGVPGAGRYGARRTGQFPKPFTEKFHTEKEGLRHRFRSMISPRALETSESRYIITKDPKVTFHINFVKGSITNERDAPGYRSWFAANLIDSFDINICQVAFDGLWLHSTQSYKQGCKDQHIEVMNLHDGTRHHLARLKNKYKGWTLGPQAEEVLYSRHGKRSMHIEPDRPWPRK
ncbi:MAG: hypothetical protein OXT65_03860 [Alphaproteobacteria bacterium]|nr:hypothetical protein [Alphaproteobacteria bacterium]